MQHLNVVALDELVKLYKKKKRNSCLNMPSANIVNGMQMLVQKIVAGLFSLVFLVFNT